MREQVFREDAAHIMSEFRGNPLRDPVDPQFNPYYKLILREGDLAAVLDHFDSHRGMDLGSSFYELIGRLVPLLRSIPAAKQLLSEIARRGAHFSHYDSWYNRLKPLCREARQFINQEYKAAIETKRAHLHDYFEHRIRDSIENAMAGSPDARELYAMAEANALVNREQLWQEYVRAFYCREFFQSIEQARPQFKEESLLEFAEERSHGIKELLGYMENPNTFPSDQFSLLEMTCWFLNRGLLPKPIFFELATSSKTAVPRAEHDRRYRNRRLLRTPSSVARKYACAIVGISPSTVSHKNMRK